MIFSEKLIKVLTRKSKLQENKKRVVDKLRKQEKLSDDEFWRVYASIWQKGPEVKYRNPHKWVDSVE